MRAVAGAVARRAPGPSGAFTHRRNAVPEPSRRRHRRRDLGSRVRHARRVSGRALLLRARGALRRPRASGARDGGRFFRPPPAELEIAAVTGTNGKTTTAFLLYSILNPAGRKPGLLGTI